MLVGFIALPWPRMNFARVDAQFILINLYMTYTRRTTSGEQKQINS